MDFINYITTKKFLVRVTVLVLILIVFNAIYGLEVVVPTNINWIMSSQHDWSTHYLGWAFYRFEPCNVPDR